ncbi:MAG: hypothetical protein M1837_006741 [Sclerophora amabilis]|nr:MAG: hypothetical protein M1837_006741 [Sclerophora amabilis]
MVPLAGMDFYDTTSDVSSPGSPTNYEQLYHGFAPVPYSMLPYSNPSATYMMEQPSSIPIGYSASAHVVGGDLRRRRTNMGVDKDTSPHIHSRRRAQNRASQRAFRDRKEKHVKDLENRLRELEDKHQTLEQSYTDLHAEHSRLQRQMEKLNSESVSRRDASDEGFSELLNDEEFETIINGSLLGSSTIDCPSHQYMNSH